MIITWESTRELFDDPGEFDGYYACVPGYMLSVDHPFDRALHQFDCSRYQWWIVSEHDDELLDEFVAKSELVGEANGFRTAADAKAACENYYRRKLSRLL